MRPFASILIVAVMLGGCAQELPQMRAQLNVATEAYVAAGRTVGVLHGLGKIGAEDLPRLQQAFAAGYAAIAAARDVLAEIAEDPGSIDTERERFRAAMVAVDRILAAIEETVTAYGSNDDEPQPIDSGGVDRDHTDPVRQRRRTHPRDRDADPRGRRLAERTGRGGRAREGRQRADPESRQAA